MNRNRNIHKILGWILLIPIILFSISGIVLNHQNTFNSIDLNRNLLPSKYSFDEWKNNYWRSNIQLGTDSLITFGKEGIFISTDNFKTFQDFNEGLPSSVGLRRTEEIAVAPTGGLFAATYGGLYHRKRNADSWQKVNLPINKRCLSVFIAGDSIYALTKYKLFKANINDQALQFEQVPLNTANLSNDMSWYRVTKKIHSGDLIGLPGILIMDLVAVVLIFIIVRSLLMTFNRKNKKKKYGRNLKKHYTLALRFSFLILVIAVTGMFLKAPLSTPLKKRAISKSSIDFRHKFSRAAYDPAVNKIFIFSRSRVFSFQPNNPMLIEEKNTPPVSGMGIQVVKLSSPGKILVASTKGIYLWHTTKNQIEPRTTKPLRANGYLVDNQGNEYVSNYYKGISAIAHTNTFGKYTDHHTSNRVSLVDFSREIHSGRIFTDLFGSYFILIIGLLFTTAHLTGYVIIRKKNVKHLINQFKK
ncbi:PepSY domain-containing protein [Puteibacter caeruleilacunae]|nr:PepSY domain-containing protein [Puteibacter caeruleilacunae]